MEPKKRITESKTGQSSCQSSTQAQAQLQASTLGYKKVRINLTIAGGVSKMSIEKDKFATSEICVAEKMPGKTVRQRRDAWNLPLKYPEQKRHKSRTKVPFVLTNRRGENAQRSCALSQTTTKVKVNINTTNGRDGK